MTRFALTVGAVLALAASGGAEDKKELPKELTAFQGTWKVAAAEVSGKPVEGIKLQFTFTGTKADYLEGDNKTGTGSFAIDAKKTPAEIDLFTEKGVKSAGIYKFDGEKLIICFIKGEDKRPKEFKSTDTNSAIVLTLERVKK